jgi:2-polyprenyl-6-methoxyphenol hydroxylase-like FAD-dependent oxidoreductase
VENIKVYWTACPECFGCSKKNLKLRKKAKLRYQMAINEFEKTESEGRTSVRPKITQYLCDNCKGSGLIHAKQEVEPNSEKYPHVAIIGAGIGGVALAVACLHRGIPFTLYERDKSFNVRSQGYGLTLQQASNAIKGFGLFTLKDGVRSSRHVVHSTDGKEIIEWGMRTHSKTNNSPKRINVHIPRQSLRLSLLELLGDNDNVQWGHRLIDLKQCAEKRVELRFQVNKELKNVKADVVIGADGIRSVVRSLIVGDNISPLRYLGYVVILGICSLDALKELESTLLDSATVFQTVNGHERIYMMPYKVDSIMWQLSFPMKEEDAKALSAKGAQALKDEACLRANWHTPIPEILSGTCLSQISGYPVYDRELLKSEWLKKSGAVTLIGDAAHPMSPFKGQGANQALLDALALARNISIACTTFPNWRETDLREIVLNEFEEEMLARSASKVKDSAQAVELLHSKTVLRQGDGPKGRCLRGSNLPTM